MPEKAMIRKLMGLGDDARSARGIFSRGTNVYANGTKAARGLTERVPRKHGTAVSSGTPEEGLGEYRDRRRTSQSASTMAKSRGKQGKFPNEVISKAQMGKQKRAASQAAIQRRLTRRVV